ncbi:MAG: hypothetical protein MRY21_04050 [Simkaniaceae bacterium]|nr:hypothetical protein [Simkaniaceae bacterium]
MQTFIQNNVFHAVDATNDRLELVEFIFDSLKFESFEDVVIVGAQHILPSTLTMFQSFFDRGLSPRNLHLIGKCYSTDILTYQKFCDLGVNVSPSSMQFNPAEKFDSYYQKSVEKFAATLNIGNVPKKVVVLDDGGQLISYLNENPSDIHQVTCVEQTTAGYRKLIDMNLSIPVINVARANLKLEYESRVVAQTAVKALENRLQSLQLQPRSILILGNGAIGSAIANFLERDFELYITDTDPEKAIVPYEDCLARLREFDLIIGCVGEQVLSAEQIASLSPGTTLVSLSSSDREFDIVKYRSEITGLIDCHQDFLTSNGVYVVNCGFPINFGDDPAEVDINEFELTRALLTAGILQGISQDYSNGVFNLINLENVLKNRYIEKYM